MEHASIVLVDMTQYGPDLALARMLESRYPLIRISKQDDVGAAFTACSPAIACFEYDFPDMANLSLLSELKQQYASVPIIMFTEQHSEALAVWALRARVWNYFVKPVAPDSVMPSLAMLARLLVNSDRRRTARETVFPPQPLPQDARFHKHRGEDKIIEAASAHIEHHLHEKLLQSDVASRCGATSFQLSRAFKRVYGITFQEYLIRRRLEKAAELLCNDSASVVDVCWTVGFRDPSHFTKMFHRYSGLTPSQYRHKWRANRKNNVNALAPLVWGES